MKKMKKIFALLIAMVMVLGMATSVFAQTVPATGGNGPATITIQNTTPDVDYSVKKAFDATADASGKIAYYKLDNNGNRITTVEGMPAEFDTYFEVDTAGNITAKPAAFKESSTTELSEGAINWLKSNSTLVPGTNVKANEDGTITFTGLEYGYYVVTSSLGDSAVTVTSTNPTATIIDKNQESSWEDGGKKIVVVGEGGKETLVNTKDLAIGDTVTYRLTINAVNYEGTKQVKQYTISDDMPEGMTFGGITKVTVTKSDDTVTTLTTDYAKNGSKEVSADADGKFSFVIPWATEEDGVWTSTYTAKATIVVEYTGTLNDKATIAGSGNENKAKFKPTYTDGTEPEGEKPDATVKVYTTSLTINKVDQDNNVLTGAEFTITGDALKTVVTSGDVFVKDAAGTYYLLNDGTYTTTAPTSETGSRYASTDKYKKESKQTLDTKTENVTATAFVDSTGKVVFEGLGAGTYTVSETVVPTGYNKIPDFQITIAQTVNQEDKTIAYTATSTAGNATVTANKVSVTAKNNKGSVLPSTGGIGTTIFYVIGAVLVIGAGIVLVTRRRMNVQ